MIKVTVHAKVNITLFVTGIEDGYHALDSVVCSASLSDAIMADRSDHDEISLSVQEPSTVHKIQRTVAAMRDRYGFGGVKIAIERNIPLGAGLGGSSASVAGAIRAINELYGLGLTRTQMTELADLTGSDNAFMLYGGAGKIINRSTPCNGFSFEPIDAVIVTKDFCDTKGVFAGFDLQPVFGGSERSEAVICALKNGDKEKLCALSQNVLTKPACALNPSIRYALETLDKSFMSGSGSSVVSLDCDEAKLLGLSQLGYKVYRVQLGAFETIIESI